MKRRRGVKGDYDSQRSNDRHKREVAYFRRVKVLADLRKIPNQVLN